MPQLLEAIRAQYPQRCGGKVATCFATTAAQGALVRQEPPRTARRAAWALAGAAAVGALALLAMQHRRK